MPLDRGTIEQQLEALGESSRWWERRELRDLPTAMHADERILAIALGKVSRSRRPGFARQWLLLVSNARLLCLQPAKGMSRRQLDLPASQITGLSVRPRLFRTRVIVVSHDVKYRLRVTRADGFKLFAALSNIMPVRPDSLAGRGPGIMVQRVVRHILALPTAALQPEAKPVAPSPPFDPTTLERRLQLLEDDVQRLQQQVDFLEDLLDQRSNLMAQHETQAIGPP